MLKNILVPDKQRVLIYETAHVLQHRLEVIFALEDLHFVNQIDLVSSLVVVLDEVRKETYQVHNFPDFQEEFTFVRVNHAHE